MLRPYRVLVIDADYPRRDQIYADSFVHTRVKSYPHNWEVKVVGWNNALAEELDYQWEGVNVFLSNLRESVKKRILAFQADVILVHFIQREFMNFYLSLQKPMIIFCHGYESTSWKRRLFNYDTLGSYRYLIPYFFENTLQLRALKKFIAASNSDTSKQFVFVSNWLMKSASEDVGPISCPSIVIPNGIDHKRFLYSQKTTDSRKKILLLRSFKARTYATDIAIQAILKLSSRPFFSELSFSIYGEGYLFPLLTKPLKKFSNVELHNRFILNKDIPAIHSGNGLFLCPSRLDTQGVLMCEAMCSGLVPITSAVAAIPEFVTDGISGFTTQSATEIAERIEYLYYNPSVFQQMSHNAHQAIMEKCSVDVTFPKEVTLVESLIRTS